jgi:hypothetical protein
MNIIFLDIDGVLVSSNHLLSNGRNREDFDPQCVKYLNELLQKTEAKIVISSNWRRIYSLNELHYIFKKNGILDRIIGVTPFFNLTTMRGDEIKAYLSNTKEKIHHFVIFDDEENMLELDNHYIQTNFQTGIQKEDIEKALSFFNGTQY